MNTPETGESDSVLTERDLMKAQLAQQTEEDQKKYLQADTAPIEEGDSKKTDNNKGQQLVVLSKNQLEDTSFTTPRISFEKNDVIFEADYVMKALYDNEEGDARLLIHLFKGKLCYDKCSEKWYVWDRHHWKKDALDEALAAVDEVVNVYRALALEKFEGYIKVAEAGSYPRIEKEVVKLIFKKIVALQSLQRKKNVLKLAASGQGSLGIEGHQWDSNPMLLGVENGVVDLRTGKLSPGKPEDYIRSYAPTEWKGNKEPPARWLFFLDQLFGKNREIIAYVQRLLGYALRGDAIEHIFIICWGTGRNGKTTLFNIIASVLGLLASPVKSEIILWQGRNRSSAGADPDLMSLRGLRIAWCSEIEKGRSLSASRLKKLCGGDPIEARALYSEEITFKPSHTLFLLTNYKPKADASDYALWERIHLLPFQERFIDNPSEDNLHEHLRNPYMQDELKAEASEILAWMVRGHLEFQKKGLCPPPEVIEASEDYKKEEDTIGQFVEEFCDTGPSESIQAGLFQSAYRGWCEDSNCKTRSKNEVADWLLKHGFERDDSKRYRMYLGITFKPED